MAIRPYNSPGVTVVETINPVLAPLVSNPSLVAVLGAATGEQSATERFILTGTVAQTLKHTGVDTTSVVVKDVIGNTVNAGAYVITQGADPDATVTGDEPYTIRRAGAPTSAITATTNGTGLTGTYVYRYSFVNAQGETGLSPASNQVVCTNQGVNLAGIAIGPATGADTATARNVYRAKVVGGVVGTYHRVHVIADNSTTTFTGDTVSDGTADANPTPANGIDSAGTVSVAYTYVDQFYYEPTLINDFDDFMDKYGDPFDSDGTINSQISLAAKYAFENGASELVGVAVKAGDTDFAQALAKLESDDGINVVIVASGDSTVHSAVVAHLNTVSGNGFYRVSVLGRDGSVTAVAADTLRLSAQAYNNEAVALVSPSRFKIINPVTLKEMVVGAQYVAAAIAGMLASRDVEVSLTRKTIAGFVYLDEVRTSTEAALDSAAGLFVIETKGAVLRVRHAITTSPTNINTRELSVVRSKYDLIRRVRDVLDSVVGLVVPASSAAQIVSGACIGVLEQIKAEGSIQGYGSVKARQLATDPTTIEVRFEYTPAYPINNIIINFMINTQTGEFALA